MSEFIPPIPAPQTEAGDNVPAPTSASTPAKMPVQKVTYHGDVGDIIGLHVINLLLNICTIGIYSFWGKTRIRRYITSHLALAKDRFEYTGTGMELFLGWLKALVIFVPIIILMEIPGVNLIVLPFFLGVIAAAVYLAMRYRLTRSRWRGIRFSLGGSVWQYIWLGVKRGFINIITLGILIPRSDIVMWTYLANHMQFGEAKFKYAGDAKRLMKVHLLSLAATIFLPILIMIVAVLIIGVSQIGDVFDKSERQQGRIEQSATPPEDVVPEAGQPTDGDPDSILSKGIAKGQKMIEKAKQNEAERKQREAEDSVNQDTQPSYSDSSDGTNIYDDVEPFDDSEQYDTQVKVNPREAEEAMKEIEKFTSVLLPLVLTFYGAIFLAVAARLWYHAALWREKFRGLQLENLRFKLEVSGKEMAKMYGLNLLIIIFTVGLGKPITTHLWIKFFTERLKIGGDIEKLIVDQNKTAIGSGMGDALAADVGFDMGL